MSQVHQTSSRSSNAFSINPISNTNIHIFSQPISIAVSPYSILYTIERKPAKSFRSLQIWFNYHQLWLPVYIPLYQSNASFFSTARRSMDNKVPRHSPAQRAHSHCWLRSLSSISATSAHRVDIAVAFSLHSILALGVVENSESLHEASKV